MWTKKVLRCVLCGHTGERFVEDSLAWTVDKGTVQAICGACVKAYRPDLVWVLNEMVNVGNSQWQAGRTQPRIFEPP